MFRALATVALCGSGIAHAQQAPVTEIVEGGGIKVGEGTVLHPIVGVETGVISNVFYEETDTVTSGLLRVLFDMVVGSLPPERMGPIAGQDEETRNFGDLALRADAQIAYEEYLSGNDDVQKQRNLAFIAAVQGIIFPKQTWRFGFADELRRENRPVNFESSEQLNRDINRLALRVQFRPAGRSLSGMLSYVNVIDYFESDDQQFANRIQHTAALNVAWQWLPMTRISADLAIGYFTGLGEASTRPTSFPLRITAGVATALTVKTTLNGYVGFGKGFYETGTDFTNVIGGVQGSYRFSPQARLALGYQYDFADSINANFYSDHAIQAKLESQVNRFAFAIGPELRLRSYRDIIVEVDTMEQNRDDVIFAVNAGATFNFRNWIAVTLDYRFVTDQTDFRYIPQAGDPPDDPSYTQQIVMAGVRAAY